VLTGKFVTDRMQPDKAIDVLDEACAHAQATAALPPDLERIVRERRRVDAAIRRRLARGESVDGGGGNAAGASRSRPAPRSRRTPWSRSRGRSARRSSGSVRRSRGCSGSGVRARGSDASEPDSDRGSVPSPARESLLERGTGLTASSGRAPEHGRRGARAGRRARRRCRGRQADRVGRMRWLVTALLALAPLAGTARAGRAQNERSAQQIAREVIPMSSGRSASSSAIPRHRGAFAEQVRGYLSRKLAEDLPPSELLAVQRTYRAFGVVPDTLDLRRLMLDLYSEQVAGYYDPDSSALFVVRGADPWS